MTDPNDDRLQAAVIAELHRDPAVPAAQVGVTVSGGAVTLTGEVETGEERRASVEAARRVPGVIALADELRVTDRNHPESHDRTDTEIAVEAARLLEDFSLGNGQLTVDVVDHIAFLAGQVKRHSEREAAEREVAAIRGVIRVVNQVEVGPPAHADDVAQQILDTFVKAAIMRAEGIVVEVDDGHVALRGTVRSFNERSVAEEAAWSTPGVRSVKNHLHVRA